jgi:hypothetical protein
MVSRLQSPSSQRPFGGSGVVFYPVDGLPTESGFLGNTCYTDSALSQHMLHHDELLACVARLTAKIGGTVLCLGMLDTSPPAFVLAPSQP